MVNWLNLLNHRNTNSLTVGDVEQVQVTVLAMTPIQRKLFIGWLDAVTEYEKLADPKRWPVQPV